MKKIVLTGGGTAGHVTPNIALLPGLKQLGYEIHYIGSYEGIESRLIADFDIPYYGVATGKFRRYIDVKNLTDPFRVIKGYSEARKIIKEIGPDIVFSKGGFVSVPVVRAAASLHVPCIIHESDMTPGLANKLCIPVADKVCCNFPETLQYLPKMQTWILEIGCYRLTIIRDGAQSRRACYIDTTERIVLQHFRRSERIQLTVVATDIQTPINDVSVTTDIDGVTHTECTYRLRVVSQNLSAVDKQPTIRIDYRRRHPGTVRINRLISTVPAEDEKLGAIGCQNARIHVVGDVQYQHKRPHC